MFLSSMSCLLAQNSVQEQYDAEVIYLQMGSYYKNGKKISLGFLLSNLEKEMQISPATVLEYGVYKKKRNAGLFLLGLSLGALVAGEFTENGTLREGLYVGALGTSLLSIPFSLSAGNQLQKAMWQRNRDVLVF